MLWGFLIGCEKGGVEDGVDLPLRWNVEAESHIGDNFLHFKWTSLLHLELFGTIHVEVGHFKPDLISDFPGGELEGYLLLHFLLGYFVGGLGVISSGR